MKRLTIVFLSVFLLFTATSCQVKERDKDVLRIRVFADSEAERDDIIREITVLLAGAEDESKCEEKLSEAGYTRSVEYYRSQWCGDRFFVFGYYPTFRVGDGEKAWQFVAYPGYVYQSLEEFENARYGSVFYELVKKMEEEDENEKS